MQTSYWTRDCYQLLLLDGPACRSIENARTFCLLLTWQSSWEHLVCAFYLDGGCVTITSTTRVSVFYVFQCIRMKHVRKQNVQPKELLPMLLMVVSGATAKDIRHALSLAGVLEGTMSEALETRPISSLDSLLIDQKLNFHHSPHSPIPHS